MFSSRLPRDTTPNALSRALDRARAAGVDLIDLTESNPTRAGLSYPPDMLAPLSRPEALRYEPAPFGLPAAREAVAADFARRGVPVPAERIVLTASTSEAYAILFKLLCNPGDRVLVPVPSYPLFEHLTRLEAVDVATYRLEYHGLWEIDFASLERAIDGGTKAVLVVSPNNPTGSWLKRDELRRLTQICASHRLALVGDEVFCDYPLERSETSVSSVVTQPDVLTFALGGLSKSAALPQVKLGWMALSGPPLRVAEASSALELICDTYLSVGTPVQVAAAELLEHGAAMRTQISVRTCANLARLRDAAASYPSCGVLRAEGGWYAVVQVPAVTTEEQLIIELLEADHVLVHPGYFFDFPREAYLVVSLLAPPERFEAGILRLLFDYETAEKLFPFVLIALVLPIEQDVMRAPVKVARIGAGAMVRKMARTPPRKRPHKPPRPATIRHTKKQPSPQRENGLTNDQKRTCAERLHRDSKSPEA